MERAAIQPDPAPLLDRLDLHLAPIGFYDAPETWAFEPLVEPDRSKGRGPCVFDFYRHWQKGETLHLTKENFGCGGAGRALCSVRTRDREDFIDFLWKDEGLRSSRELMAGWVDAAPTYQQEHDHVLLGRLRPDQYRYLRSVTFWVNPDQLSVLQHGAYYDHAWGDPPPVVVPFGSGCMELVATFEDLSRPQAAIGATDVAMRGELPPDVLAFTVTVPLFERLCALDERSFLGKGFLKALRRARGGRLG